MKYLQIAHERSCRVLFISPHHAKDPLYFAISFAGILQRSSGGDQLLVGRKEFEESEVYDFCVRNFKDFEVYPGANVKKLEWAEEFVDDENVSF